MNCLTLPRALIGSDGWATNMTKVPWHRRLYIAAHGGIQKDFQIHHICRTRSCINPCHLIALPSHLHLKLHQKEGSVTSHRNHRPLCKSCGKRYKKARNGRWVCFSCYPSLKPKRKVKKKAKRTRVAAKKRRKRVKKTYVPAKSETYGILGAIEQAGGPVKWNQYLKRHKMSLLKELSDRETSPIDHW